MNFAPETQLSKFGNKISCLTVILAPWLVPIVNRWLHAEYLNLSPSMKARNYDDSYSAEKE
jgi:hypothetical protein